MFQQVLQILIENKWKTAEEADTVLVLEKKEEKEKTEKGRKRKALEEDLIAAKKEKLELERVSKKLLDTADKKAKDAEKKKDATVMKALLIESNASRERAEQIQKKDIPAQDKEIKKIEEKIRRLTKRLLVICVSQKYKYFAVG